MWIQLPPIFAYKVKEYLWRNAIGDFDTTFENILPKTFIRDFGIIEECLFIIPYKLLIIMNKKTELADFLKHKSINWYFCIMINNG